MAERAFARPLSAEQRKIHVDGIFDQSKDDLDSAVKRSLLLTFIPRGEKDGTLGNREPSTRVRFVSDSVKNCRVHHRWWLATSQDILRRLAAHAPRPPGGRKARAYHSTPAFFCANEQAQYGMPTPSCGVKGHEIDGGGSAHDSRTHCRGRTPSGPASSPTGGRAAWCHEGHPQEAAGAAFGALPRGHFWPCCTTAVQVPTNKAGFHLFFA